jgi:D-alanyl-D-alanine carboxypeptidase
MIRAMRPVLFLPALLAAACALPMPRHTPPTLESTSLDATELDRVISQYVEDQALVGLSVGVMHEGRLVLVKGYGTSSLETHAPVTPETMFAIGSVTKQFTCAAVMLAAEDGKLSLRDRVAKYDPSLRRAEDISLLQLGQHVSGYADYYPLDFVDRVIVQPRSAEQITRDYARRPLDFEPGTKWSYSNTGFLILEEAVARASGESFSTFLSNRIFMRLHLDHTGYELAMNDPRAARGYTSFGMGAPERATPEGRGWLGGAGAIWSTPSDLLAWDSALMNGVLLSKASLRAMTTPARLPDGRSTAYGCGLNVKEDGPAKVFSHNGAVSGFRASNTFIPANQSAVVLMANRDFASLTPLREAILAKLMPKDTMPAIAGPSADEAVRAFLQQLRDRKVDRSKLGEEFRFYLTDAKIADSSRALARNAPSDFEPAVLSERGGMEVSRTKFKLGDVTMQALMYRTPDGTIQQFLFFRQ